MLKEILALAVLSGVVSAKEPTSFRQAHTEKVKSAILAPQGVFGFFEPGEPVQLKLHIDGKATNYEYTLLVKDDTGSTVVRQEKKALTDTITLPAQSNGYYSAVCDIYAEGALAYTIQGGFVVAPQPGKRDPFFQFGFGVVPEMHDGYKRVGCGAISLKLSWQPIIKHHNVQNMVNYFLKQAYRPFLESGDFELTASLGTTLARSNGVRTPEDLRRGMPLVNDDLLKLYVDFIKEIAPQLNIKKWYIGQETPSNAKMQATYVGTWSEAMANFVVLTRLASRQLKELDPEIKIIAGGNNVMACTDNIEPLQMGDLMKDFDSYYIDAYVGNWDLGKGPGTIPEAGLMKFYEKASALSVSLGKGKYIYNDETGYCIPYGAPFDQGKAWEQAWLTARSLIMSKAAPVLAYELHMPNFRPASNDADKHMATIWKTLPMGKALHRVPLPGGAMYATAASELAFAKFEKEVVSGNFYSYIFAKPDGTSLVAIWNVEKAQPFQVELPSGSTIRNTYGRDLTGKPLVVTPSPLYITIPQPAPATVALMQEAMRKNAPEMVCAAFEDTVYVRSLLKKPQEAEIHLPDGKPVKVTIQPGKVNAFPMPVHSSGKLQAGGRQYEIPLEKVPVLRLKRVSGLEELRQGQPGILQYPDHIRPTEALHPERCYFKTDFNPNGHNVSAKYWAGYDDRNFYLAVEVDDPVHLQRQTLQDLWRDDCLQFVLSPEEYLPPVMVSASETTPVSEYNYGLALTPKGTQLMKFLGKDAGPKSFPANVTRRNGRTLYEVALPWSAVGGKSKRFGFVVFDNNDRTQEKSPYWLEFSPGIADGMDSSKLARLVFE